MTNFHLNIPSPLQKIDDDLFDQHNVEVFIKRDDLIHAEISGNKWRKLQFNVEKFNQKKYAKILTFGGAFSNHIAATAALGKWLGIQTIGIIRGDELNEESNETLSRARLNGMQLVFVTRADYDMRYERIYHEELRRTYGNILIIEEGGAGYLGVLGVGEIIKELPFEPDYIYTASGTGTTTAGLLLATEKAKVVGVSVLKNGAFLNDEVKNMIQNAVLDESWTAEIIQRLTIETEFHFGGYGKYTTELIDFMNSCYQHYQIPLDQIYTGKMFYAFLESLRDGKIKKNSKVVLLHTGGHQGRSSLKEKLIF